ncbi:MAG: hypothetical protein U0354_13780 [Candidatus Sericytochromatia bacterium]
MKKFKVCLSALLSLLIVSSCSSGNPTTPNRGALTNLSKNPTPTTETELKKINLSGRVVDSVTRKPIEGANILLYVISNDDILKKVKDNLKNVIPTESSPNPNSSNVEPKVDSSNSPNPNDIGATPKVNNLPSVTPSSQPKINPLPIEENEEKVISPSLKPSPSPSVISPKDLLNKSKDIASPPKPATSSSSQPSPSVSTNTKENKDKVDNEIKDISEELLSSALSSLNINDVQEFEGKTGNDGKFWINKVPDTSVIITITAPNYKTTSIFNLDTNKVEDILIDPVESKKHLLSVYGNVYSATNTVINNATVSASYPIGDIFSIPVNSDTEGKFKIEDIKEGDRTFIATVKEPDGKISSMGLLDFDIKKGEKATLVPKSEIKKDDTKKDNTLVIDKSIPNIKIKSITEYIDIKGKVDTKEKISESEKNTLKSINVYINFKKKGLPKEEVFLTDIQIPAKSDNFELSLPKLDSGYTYHLEFVSVNKKGNYIYHHENNIKQSNKEMKIKFISGISSGKADFITKEGTKLPIFTWNPVTEATYYKVSINKMDKDNNITTVWEGLTPFNTAIYPITTGNAKLNSSNKYFWSVVAIKEGSVSQERINYGKLAINTWTDLSSSSNMELSLTNTQNDEIEEIESKKEG